LGVEETDPHAICISVRCDEDRIIEGLDMLMTRFPSLAAVFVGSKSTFRLIERRWMGAPVYYKPQRSEIIPSARMHDAGIRDISLVKAYSSRRTQMEKER
jgi:hypothetical protein